MMWLKKNSFCGINSHTEEVMQAAPEKDAAFFMPKKLPNFKLIQKSKAFAPTRVTALKRGYGSAWRKARSYYLSHHPLCVSCQKSGVMESATEVDHIRPHKGDKTLFWDSSNWQPLCHSCHSKKTASEDGGFGNK